MPISKIEAARRQLDTAIDLFFRGGDHIAIATLAYNALEISRALSLAQGKLDWTCFEDVAEAHKMSTADVWRLFAKPRNFYKHADRDPCESLDDPAETDAELLLALTVLQFGEVAERSVEMWAALVWVYALHPEFGTPEAMRDLVDEFAFLRELPRSQQLKMRPGIIAELRVRAR